MLQVDWQIEKWMETGDLVIDPRPTEIQPASVDLHIDGRIMRWDWANHRWFDDPQDRFIRLHTGECVLGCTQERVVLPDCLSGRVEGKSSHGRLFLLVHVTAGFIDNGFGKTADSITLELVNLGPTELWIPVGAPICQISFTKTANPMRTYHGHYAAQKGPTVSRYEHWRNDPDACAILPEPEQ